MHRSAQIFEVSQDTATRYGIEPGVYYYDVDDPDVIEGPFRDAGEAATMARLSGFSVSGGDHAYG